MLNRPVPADGIVAEDLDDDVCLYLPATDEALVLNQPAGDVWRLADGELTVDEIIARLAAVYARAADDLREDVLAVVADLAARGCLVEFVPDPS
jgi:hypothetical protein